MSKPVSGVARRALAQARQRRRVDLVAGLKASKHVATVDDAPPWTACRAGTPANSRAWTTSACTDLTLSDNCKSVFLEATYIILTPFAALWWREAASIGSVTKAAHGRGEQCEGGA